VRERSRETDRHRGSAAERGYSTKWRAARLVFLRGYPLCKAHLERGEIVVATEVDHVVPHRGDPRLFWDRTNWQSLCKSCHSAKTGRGQ